VNIDKALLNCANDTRLEFPLFEKHSLRNPQGPSLPVDPLRREDLLMAESEKVDAANRSDKADQVGAEESPAALLLLLL
jgi:hypothetical protein